MAYFLPLITIIYTKVNSIPFTFQNIAYFLKAFLWNKWCKAGKRNIEGRDIEICSEVYWHGIRCSDISLQGDTPGIRTYRSTPSMLFSWYHIIVATELNSLSSACPQQFTMDMSGETECLKPVWGNASWNDQTLLVPQVLRLAESFSKLPGIP